MLTDKQRKNLRTLAHHRKPVVLLGNAGLTAAVLAEIDGALTQHELIKIRLRVTDRASKKPLLEQICRQTSAELVQAIGHTAVLFRINPDKPRIVPG